MTAARRLVASKTTIPIPRLIAYALGDDAEPLSSFLILEFIEGQKFDLRRINELPEEQITNLYTSLADIYIQLRRLEFPSIGCLGFDSEGVRVSKRTVSIDINMQELEGLQPSEIQASYCDADGRLTSANKYVDMLLDISDNAFAKSRDSVLEPTIGGDYLFHRHLFRGWVREWVEPSLDQGPFVMVHGDLEHFNLLVDQDMSIVGLLDWEWSRIVPRQFFIPPLWLDKLDTTYLAFKYFYETYLEEKFHPLLDIVRSRELERFGETLLADEWTEAKNKSGFLTASALENHTEADWFACRYIQRQRFRCEDKEQIAHRIEQFMEDPTRRAFIAAKIEDGKAYQAELDKLKSAKSGATGLVSPPHS